MFKRNPLIVLFWVIVGVILATLIVYWGAEFGIAIIIICGIAALAVLAYRRNRLWITSAKDICEPQTADWISWMSCGCVGCYYTWITWTSYRLPKPGSLWDATQVWLDWQRAKLKKTSVKFLAAYLSSPSANSVKSWVLHPPKIPSHRTITSAFASAGDIIFRWKHSCTAGTPLALEWFRSSF